MLETIGTILGLASSAKNLFSKSKSEKDTMEDQLGMQLASARQMPSAQVEGLRAAGLNPMLAVGHGISAPPPITASPGAETQASTAKSLASATIANQTAQAALYNAQADNVKADTLNKLELPEQTKSSTALIKAQTATEAWGPENRKWATELLSAQYGKTVAEKDAISIWQRKLVEAQTINYAATTKILNEELRTARTKAELDEAFMKIERIIAMGAEGAGAVTGGLANSAKALFGNKPKTIIQRAPNITIRNK